MLKATANLGGSKAARKQAFQSDLTQVQRPFAEIIIAPPL